MRVRFPIANILTLARIAMIPAVGVLFYLPYSWSDPAAAIVFILAAITDTLDGYLARKLGQMTRLGAFLDPVADKLIVAVALVLLVSHDPTKQRLLWFDSRILLAATATVIVCREIAISALREWMAELGTRKKVAVSSLGKIKTIFQMTGLSMMLFRENLFKLPIYEIGLYCLIIAAVLTLWSMVLYLRAAWPDLRGSIDMDAN